MYSILGRSTNLLNAVSTNSPLVSFIITNFKGISWLPPCIDSIQRSDYTNYEINIIERKDRGIGIG